MSLNGTLAYILAKNYTDTTTSGLGTIKGAPATIKSITDTDNGHKVTFEWTGSDGTKQTTDMIVANGTDGISPTVTVEDTSEGHKITITDKDGSKTVIVKDGVDGGKGDAFKYEDFTDEQLKSLKGKDGNDGKSGSDGVSPLITVTETSGTHTVTILDKSGSKSFVVKDGSAVNLENYYNKDEVTSKLNNKADKTDIPTVPTNVSQLTNDENYIKNTVENLTNYYKKTEIYTKEEVSNLISNIKKLTSQIVDTLPTENIDTSVIYLVKETDTTNYMQYMYINNVWAELGSTQVNLSEVYTKTEIDTKLTAKADKTEIPTVPTNVSSFANDAGYLTEYTEIDPTVPAWAKEAAKPAYTAAEVGALPEDTEIPIFPNKTVLDKFTENDEGIVLYDGKQIASGNLWSGTKTEYEAIENKDPDTTYVITDEEESLANYVIEDSAVTDNKTWSSKKDK